MIPIVICSFQTPSLEILQESIRVYSPNTPIHIHTATQGSFGADMNMALDFVFSMYDEVIISNDDVVITPNSIPKLLEDVQKLKTRVPVNELGFVQSLVDNGRYVQNIRFKFFVDEKPANCRWPSEDLIKCVPVVAPIFAYMSKVAFKAARFPPLNWYSDDVICEDLVRLGFKHFVSTSYVHHVGSDTIGVDYEKLSKEAMKWVIENRPEYIEEFNKRMNLPENI